MPDEEQSSLAEKPAGMSFSDWKKMKSALTSSAENNVKEKEATQKSGKKGSQLTKSPNNYNNNRQNNRDKKIDYRQQQSLQYFESLKQNNLRIFGAGSMRNTNFPGNQMLMMQALNNTARTSGNMGMFNSINSPFNNNRGNNMGPFNNNMGPFSNNMGLFNNNMGLFNNNIGPFNNNGFNNNMASLNNIMGPSSNNANLFKRPMPLMQQSLNPSIARHSPRSAYRNPHNNHVFTDNYMGKNNNFESMLDVPIPQQPYKLPSLMSARTQKRGTIGNKKNSVNKPNDAKVETNKASGTNNQAVATAPTTQKRTRSTKQKKEWKPIKPQMPPPIIALTPEAHEAKQRMWREYRQKIKPFKNKDFLNAKRVIQRLKKKPYEELDEKEKERWEKANEFVNSHKKMLTEKAIARGEAATVRATRVQDALYSEKNYTRSNASAEVSSPLANHINASIKDSEHGLGENTKKLPSSNEVAGASNITENWELWNSFVPGGMLIRS